MRIVEDFKYFTEGGGVKKAIATLIFNPCFHSVCLYRLSAFFYRIHMQLVAKIIWYVNRLLFCVDIDYRAQLAGGFYLVHGLGTVIGHEVRSLGRLKVYQGVTLGGGNGDLRYHEDGSRWGQPLIEKNVIIYTGAGLFGAIRISEGTVIKAGSIISKDM